jgi:serine protease AprX
MPGQVRSRDLSRERKVGGHTFEIRQEHSAARGGHARRRSAGRWSADRHRVRGDNARAQAAADKDRGFAGQWGDSAVDYVALDSHGVNQPQLDPGSLLTVSNAIGARNLWGQHDASGKAVTGQGVTVAVLDSGIEPVAGLNAPGQLIQGPDLSLEANSSLDRGHDTFGHGTHLAGIIAARDDRTTDTSGKPTGLTNTQQMGIAPGARVLAVKAATADGSADVSEVIAGLDWIVAHRNDNGMNVRVVNLSFGTDSTQSYLIDPLTAAVEDAWRHGIVVVVSAGNEGNTTTQLTDPATDPYVIAVGASDPNLQVSGWQAPAVAKFSNSGNATRSPDLVAPGRSIVSLRDPGSYIDTEHPEGLVTGDSSGRLFRGSGTSQAAAVVSGAVTLLTQAFPNATPDQLKAALKNTAKQLYGAPTTLQGAGELSVNDAYSYLKSLFPTNPSTTQLAKLASFKQSFAPGTGLGSLEAARGGSHLVDPTTGAPLYGEVDVQGVPWNPSAWQSTEEAGTAWAGGSWLGVQYTGSGWAGTAAWTSAPWSAARWSGAQWTDADWTAHRWSAHRWSSALWTSALWSAHLWD